MSALTFKVAAKTDVGLVRTNNEDNLCVITNLDVAGSTWVNNEICQLGNKGVLLVVADGMGGMNAGEVASEIAVTVVKDRFTHEVTDAVLQSDETIVRFMNDTIVLADNTIKEEGKHRAEAKGMGTTIVVAWLYEERLYVSWCGDSRAYIFNPQRGLFQISKDHSYVQELVDKGVLKPEDAFDFPESNVITRCLSHSSMKAVPDNLAAPYRVSTGDTLMLCTDGLSGMIRDYEISDVMAAHTDNMSECVDALIHAAKDASGADNVTVCLCQVLSMGEKESIGRTDTAKFAVPAEAPASAPASTPASAGEPQAAAATTGPEEEKPAAQPAAQPAESGDAQPVDGKRKKRRIKWVALCLTLVVVLLAAAVWLYPKVFGKDTADNEAVITEQVDAENVENASSVVEETMENGVLGGKIGETGNSGNDKKTDKIRKAVENSQPDPKEADEDNNTADVSTQETQNAE